jgi:hypothetical protein
VTDARETVPAEDPHPEEAVRRYLQFVEDPSTARDEALLGRLRHQLSSATDPIEKLKVIAQIEQAEQADGESIRTAFVRHARVWAEEHGVTVSAFRQLGVSDIALAEAGFDLGFARRQAPRPVRSGTARTGSPGVSRGSAGPSGTRTRGSADDIRSWMLAHGSDFTLAQAMAGAGGSLGTVKKVVDDLVAVGQIRNLGPDPDHRGRGRAPHRYGRAD